MGAPGTNATGPPWRWVGRAPPDSPRDARSHDWSARKYSGPGGLSTVLTRSLRDQLDVRPRDDGARVVVVELHHDDAHRRFGFEHLQLWRKLDARAQASEIGLAHDPQRGADLEPGFPARVPLLGALGTRNEDLGAHHSGPDLGRPAHRGLLPLVGGEQPPGALGHADGAEGPGEPPRGAKRLRAGGPPPRHA